MPKSPLPPKPNLEKLKKQAKALLRAHKSGDVSVCRTFRLVHRFKRLTEKEILLLPVTLNDCQFALALSYGFRNWNELKIHVGSVTSVQREVEPISRRTKEANLLAREHADNAIKLSPDSPEAHTLLGSTHLWDWEAAEDPKPGDMLDLAYGSFQKALSLDPELAAAHTMLSAVHAHRKQRALAIAEIQMAASLSPNSADLHADMARIYRNLRMPEEALPAITEAIRLEPKRDHLSVLGMIYADLGRHAESYEVFREAAESAENGSEGTANGPGIPDMERQRESFARFLQMEADPQNRRDAGLQKVFKSVFPIGNSTQDLSLDFVCYRLAEAEHSVKECTRSGMTYDAPILVVIRLVFYNVDKESGTRSIRDIREQEIHFGAIPLMTDRGTFIVNGRERAVLSNHNRSSGVFFGHDKGNARSTDKVVFRSRILPVRGSWLEMEVDHGGIVYAQIDRRQKFPVTMLLKALGYSAENILDHFYKTETIRRRGQRYFRNFDEVLLVGQRACRDVDDPTGNGVIVKKDQVLSGALLRRIKSAGITEIPIASDDLLNRAFARTITGSTPNQPIVSSLETVDEETLAELMDAGINEFELTQMGGVSSNNLMRKTLNLDKTDSSQEALREIHRLLRPKVPSTPEVAQDFIKHMFFKPTYYDLSSVGRLRINHCLGIDTPINLRFLTKEDILLTVKVLVELSDTQGRVDGIGHLSSVGELLEYLYHIGLMQTEPKIRERMERMGVQQDDALMPDDLVDPRSISTVMEEFFGGVEDTKWYP